MKQDADFFKKRRKYIKQLKDRRRAYEKMVGDIQHDLEVEFRDLRRSAALQRTIARNDPDADPVVSARCDEYYRKLTEIIGPKI